MLVLGRLDDSLERGRAQRGLVKGHRRHEHSLRRQHDGLPARIANAPHGLRQPASALSLDMLERFVVPQGMGRPAAELLQSDRFGCEHLHASGEELGVGPQALLMQPRLVVA